MKIDVSRMSDAALCAFCKQPYGWVGRVRVCRTCNIWPDGIPEKP